MDIDLEIIAALAGAMLVAGMGAGLLAGMLGVGGGLVIVPALLALFDFLNVDEAVRMQLAVGTSLSTIIATSLSSIRSHHKRGAVDWRLLRSWAPAVAVGVLIGAWIAGMVHGQVMTAIFATVALAAAANLTFTPENLRLTDRLPGQAVMAPIGVCIGILSSLMGIGGGQISVPTMVLCNYPVRRAVGTSSAIGLVIAVFGTAGFVVSGWGTEGLPPFSLGFVNVIGFLVLMPTTVLFAPIGARIAHTIPPIWLKRAFAAFLCVVALRLLLGLLL
ncbi:MAG TPA: sulfite exporter TauE/SafE family protein [Alphaproteobacteria bacterium]|nr:sulfite exporter TauE/SafE family protein [Alphaproteobacteria bacterium]